MWSSLSWERAALIRQEQQNVAFSSDGYLPGNEMGQPWESKKPTHLFTGRSPQAIPAYATPGRARSCPKEWRFPLRRGQR
jgi:hypothetical protein